MRGFAYTVEGASASGQVAILQAIQALQVGRVDVRIAMGALIDRALFIVIVGAIFVEIHS